MVVIELQASLKVAMSSWRLIFSSSDRASVVSGKEVRCIVAGSWLD